MGLTSCTRWRVCTKDTGATDRHHWCSMHRYAINPRPQSPGTRAERGSYIKGTSRIAWPDSTTKLTTDIYYQPQFTTTSRHGHLPLIPTNSPPWARGTLRSTTWTRRPIGCHIKRYHMTEPRYKPSTCPNFHYKFHPVTRRQHFKMTEIFEIDNMHNALKKVSEAPKGSCALCPPHTQMSSVLPCKTLCLYN